MKPRAALPASCGRRAKIVCTIGPACDSEECIADLMRLGMDVARLNFSHGTHPEHARRIQRLRDAARKLKRTICILQDLQGPKIRTGRLMSGAPVELKKGSVLTITPRPGLLVIFPSFVLHAVRPYRGDAVRISIAMNFGVNPLDPFEKA